MGQSSNFDKNFSQAISAQLVTELINVPLARLNTQSSNILGQVIA